MPVDISKVVCAEVIQWEVDEGIYGVSYVTIDGPGGEQRIGTRQEAQAIVDQVKVPRESVIDLAQRIRKR